MRREEGKEMTGEEIIWKIGEGAREERTGFG
jgi:hypothetical protein